VDGEKYCRLILQALQSPTRLVFVGEESDYIKLGKLRLDSGVPVHQVSELQKSLEEKRKNRNRNFHYPSMDAAFTDLVPHIGAILASHPSVVYFEDEYTFSSLRALYYRHFGFTIIRTSTKMPLPKMPFHVANDVLPPNFEAIVIIMPSGGGKTTNMERLASRRDFPIIIDVDKAQGERKEDLKAMRRVAKVTDDWTEHNALFNRLLIKFILNSYNKQSGREPRFVIFAHHWAQFACLMRFMCFVVLPRFSVVKANLEKRERLGGEVDYALAEKNYNNIANTVHQSHAEFYPTDSNEDTSLTVIKIVEAIVDAPLAIADYEMQEHPITLEESVRLYLDNCKLALKQLHVDFVLRGKVGDVYTTGQPSAGGNRLFGYLLPVLPSANVAINYAVWAREALIRIAIERIKTEKFKRLVLLGSEHESVALISQLSRELSGIPVLHIGEPRSDQFKDVDLKGQEFLVADFTKYEYASTDFVVGLFAPSNIRNPPPPEFVALMREKAGAFILNFPDRNYLNICSQNPIRHLTFDRTTKPSSIIFKPLTGTTFHDWTANSIELQMVGQDIRIYSAGGIATLLQQYGIKMPSRVSLTSQHANLWLTTMLDKKTHYPTHINTQTAWIFAFSKPIRQAKTIPTATLHTFRRLGLISWAKQNKLKYQTFIGANVHGWIQINGRKRYLAVSGHFMSMLLQGNLYRIDFNTWFEGLEQVLRFDELRSRQLTNHTDSLLKLATNEMLNEDLSLSIKSRKGVLWHNYHEYKSSIAAFILLALFIEIPIDKTMIRFVSDKLDYLNEKYPIIFNKDSVDVAPLSTVSREKLIPGVLE
jgi:hypothetical protein